MKPVAPELVAIEAGPVILGVPPCPAMSKVQHRWPAPREAHIPLFHIARHTVTRAEYAVFVEATAHPLPSDWSDPLLLNPRLPACGVSAEDADAYCLWLSNETGKNYRLPRANEWEKAARGGLVERKHSWGDEPPQGRCCFGEKGTSAPRPVGSFAPNGFGLFDMVGNVWQWLADRYTEVASDSPLNTPTGKPAALNRVLVGGSFMTADTDYLWVAYRHDDPPDLRHRCLGFRVAG